MSTKIGYVVNTINGNSIPIESVLVVGFGDGTAAYDKSNGLRYGPDKHMLVLGADESRPEVMQHPAFCVKMITKALATGQPLAKIWSAL